MPNLNDFKSTALKNGGARANLFEVEGSIGGQTDSELLKFLCKSASIPASNMGEIGIPWRGRTFKIPGDRTFDDWDLTIISDAAFDLRQKFEQWNNEFQSHQDNISSVKNISTNNFMDWKIYWLDREGNRAREYTFVGCWPKVVGAIDVAFDNNDSLAEFPVTMSYQWWTSPATS